MHTGTKSPAITLRHHRVGGGSTAVCLAGEARTFLSSRVRQTQQANLLQPLVADLFLVLSPRSSGAPESWLTQLQLVEQQLDPVSIVVARDEQMGIVLQQLALPQDEARLIYECTRVQPLPTRPVSRGDNDWRAWFQVGACVPQLSLALRHRVCLELIEHTERQRRFKYDWVVRSRPDVAVPCALPHSAVLKHEMVRYFMDFIVFMPRGAADTVLREVPLARQWNVSECYSYRDENAMGACNAALASRAGWHVVGLEASVWVPSERRFERQELVYPARKDDRPRDARALTARHRTEHEIVPRPHPPFGNVSSRSNPQTPNGAIYPRCVLAPNATSALAQQTPTRPAVPFLCEPGVWRPKQWEP
jgi:hypothetical protein